MGLFSFAESPQLQALLADVADPTIRDTSFALYFTLAFGVGSLWTYLYGRITEAIGDVAGLPVVFVLMAVSFVLAALAVVPIREPRRPGSASVRRPATRQRANADRLTRRRAAPDASAIMPTPCTTGIRSGRGAAW